MSVEDYRHGPLRRMARFALYEFINGSSEPFISRYYIEQYAGGATQASVEKTDIVEGRGFDSHQMTYYDYTNLLQRIEATAEMVQLMAEVTHE